MKKLLTLLLTLLMVFTLVGCNSTKEEEPVVVDTPEINEPETKIEEPVVVENTETKEETVDPTQYSYWVVFKNPDGNELQRTIEKYGTTPVYTGDTPVYWDSENWYKFTNWDKELKPITTNTYITAEYEYGGELKKEESATTPAPDPEYVQLTCLTSPVKSDSCYIISGLHASDNMKFEFKAQLTKAYSSVVFGYWKAAGNGFSFASYSKNTADEGLDMYFGNIEAVYKSSSIFGAEHTYEYQLKQDDTYVKMDGNEVYRRPTPYTITFDSTLDIPIFTSMYTGNVPMDSQPLSLYYLKIYQGGSLVRDYIPVKTIKEINGSKNATNPGTAVSVDTLCLYDKLNDKYYLNSGTVAFTDTPIY